MVRRRLVLRLRIWVPRFVATLILLARFAARLVPSRTPRRRWRRLLAAGRLDATQRAAQFVNLAFVGQLLAFGNLNEFEHFVELVNHPLERRGDFRGVFNGLTNGRGFSGAEIGGLDPRLGARRFRAAFGPAFFRATLARRFGSVIRFRRNVRFRSGFDRVNFR
jgi:hypothetical protein